MYMLMKKKCSVKDINGTLETACFYCLSSRVNVSLEISCKATHLKVRFSYFLFLWKVFMKCGPVYWIFDMYMIVGF